MAGPPRPPALTDTLAPPDVGVGSRLGKYEIIKRLATGGMAEIFLARVSGLPGFQKMVVIKRILPQLATKTDFVEMFLDEARIAATLQHPNVVQMYDVGVVDGNYFIAMEYLHGEDVRSLSRSLHRQDKKLPLEHALNIVIGVASGLHYAHEKVGFDGKPLEIVHRDVTPQNIIVTYDGAVKLLDFGIAKASNRFGETRFGTLKGKVPYMSPEQCRGEPLDRRSDIFSLGIMLYELTLGKRLYQGKSDFEVLKQIVEGTVTPPSELDKEYPQAARRDRDARAREGEGQALSDGARHPGRSRGAGARRSAARLADRADALHGGDVREQDRGVARGAGQGRDARRAPREAAGARRKCAGRRRSRRDWRDAGARGGAHRGGARGVPAEDRARYLGRARRGAGEPRRGDARARRAGADGGGGGCPSSSASRRGW